MSHTPGPWHVNIQGGEMRNGQTYRRMVLIDMPNLKLGNTVDDARLIAAAPALLTALKALISIGWNDGLLANAYEKEVVAAEAAIACAEGQKK